MNSPLRGPFMLFFLLATPTAAIGAALHGLEPASRLVVALAGAFAVNLLVAQAMLAAHRWSPWGGVAAVAALSLLIFLLVLVQRLRSRARPLRRTQAAVPGAVRSAGPLTGGGSGDRGNHR
ncbi:hypothetical protein [Streptomyces sp. NPDC056817]|uniref:hypothetical protein n=1 Tax=Streptomyces sp. NPDC056817 TaxID=3345950 RepID=UPI0036BEFD8F